MNLSKAHSRIALLLALVTAGFVSGFHAKPTKNSSSNPNFFERQAFAAEDPTKLPPTETYLAVLNTIRTDYASQAPGAKAPDLMRLTYAAIDGMLETLHDRYTEFWTPREYAQNMEETSGVFAGIGTTLDITKDGRVVVLETIESSPAAKMGVFAGDIITHINNHAAKGRSLDAITDQIKGEPGTAIRLTLARKNHQAPIQVLLTRAMVSSPLVEWRMQDAETKIGYVSLSMFGEAADVQFAAAVTKLEKRGMRAMIFDLRDNPGGLLNVAQDLASRFVDKGPVVWIQEKSGKMSPLPVEKNKHQNRLHSGDYPIAVLVNGNSASAAEIVAGAIKDHQVGTLVGTRTFGKGLVQTIFPLDDDSAVKITTQRYFTPNKSDINKRYNLKTGARISGGIIPDVPTELTDADWERMRDARRSAPQDKLAQDKQDPQMQKALTLLQKQLEPQ
ncbi:MAG: S41 family peptidase [Akkermansiaceae bacterium]|nr:S41 family peptidase [Armatimonadota bacterium]